LKEEEDEDEDEDGDEELVYPAGHAIHTKVGWLRKVLGDTPKKNAENKRTRDIMHAHLKRHTRLSWAEGPDTKPCVHERWTGFTQGGGDARPCRSRTGS
jgi:hypothetical protein